MATSMPMAPEIRPLTMLPEDMTAMVESPNRQSQRLSGPPKRRAKRASGAAMNSRNRVPTMPPKEDESSEVIRALSALPLWHMGRPSKVVATEEGVPGVQMRQAEFAPP